MKILAQHPSDLVKLPLRLISGKAGRAESATIVLAAWCLFSCVKTNCAHISTQNRKMGMDLISENGRVIALLCE